MPSDSDDVRITEVLCTATVHVPPPGVIGIVGTASWGPLRKTGNICMKRRVNYARECRIFRELRRRGIRAYRPYNIDWGPYGGT